MIAHTENGAAGVGLELQNNVIPELQNHRLACPGPGHHPHLLTLLLPRARIPEAYVRHRSLVLEGQLLPGAKITDVIHTLEIVGTCPAGVYFPGANFRRYYGSTGAGIGHVE